MIHQIENQTLCKSRILNFSSQAISSSFYNFESLIWAILSGKMFEHFEHQKIPSDHWAISSLIFRKKLDQNRAFFEYNQAFFEHGSAEPIVNTNFWYILHTIWEIVCLFSQLKRGKFSVVHNKVLMLNIERAFWAFSFNPSDLEHKIFDLFSIGAWIEQFF